MKWIRVRDFFLQVSKNCIAGSSRNEIVAEIVPSRLTRRLMAFGNYVGDGAGWGVGVKWSVQLNGVPLKPLDAVVDPMDGYGRPIEIAPLDFPGASEFAVRADNPDAADHIVGVILRGEEGYYE